MGRVAEIEQRSAGAFAEQLAVQELSEGYASGVGLALQLRSVVAGHADSDDLVAGFAPDGGGSAGGALLRWHGSDDIRPRNVLTGTVVTGHNKGMTKTEKIEALRVELAEEECRNVSRGVTRSQRAAWLKRRIAVLAAKA